MKIKLLLSFLSICFISSAQVPSYIPTNSLVGWWPFNNNANDESNNGNNGTLLNGVVSTTDRFNNTNSAYIFDGVDDRIFINTAFFDNGWSQYSISMWFYLNTVSNTNNSNSSHYFFNTSSHNGLGWGMNWGNSGKYHLFAGSGTPSSSWNAILSTNATQNILTGVWKHVVLTKNGTTLSLYVDGIFDHSWTSSVSIQSYFYKTYFGSTDPAAASEVINGKLDDVGIWDRLLTPTEILTVYQSNPAGIKENTLESDFCSVYPNPANQNLVIDIDTQFIQKLDDEITLTVFSSDGKLVKTEKMNKDAIHNNKLNIENLAKGLYFLKLSSGKYHQSVKFIKTN